MVSFSEVLSSANQTAVNAIRAIGIVSFLSACSSGAYDSTEEVNSLSQSGAVSQGQAATAAQVLQNAPTCTIGELDNQLLDALNAARAQARFCGDQFYEAVGPVTWNCKLEVAALDHAQDMGDNNFFSHTGSDGLRVGSRATAAGYQWNMVGENIAAGFYTVGSVMQGWLDSPSHCSAIMNGYYEEGATVAYIADNADYEVYWAMVLGHPMF